MAPDPGSATPAFTTLVTRQADGTMLRQQVVRVPLREVYEYVEPKPAAPAPR